MADKVLVAYGTKYGATKEIAEKIGEILKGEGIPADVLPADRTTDPGQYNAFVIGSAIYMGFWRKEAIIFVENNINILTKCQVWIFSSGPTGEGDITEQMKDWKYPPKLKLAIEQIKPKDITAFHGAADPAKLTLIHKAILKMVKAPTGDFRKWDVIESWAKDIAEQLKK